MPTSSNTSSNPNQEKNYNKHKDSDRTVSKILFASKLPYAGDAKSPHAKPKKITDILPQGEARKSATMLLQHLNASTDFRTRLAHHVEQRREQYDIRGTGIPCLVFVTYYYNNVLYCKVSLSGHNSQKTDGSNLINDFYAYMDGLINDFNKINKNNTSVPLYEFVDYDSQEYDYILDQLNFKRDGTHADIYAKSCGERKIFCHFMKLCADDADLKIAIDGFCAVALEIKPVEDKLKSKHKKKCIVVTDHKRSNSLSYYRLNTLKPCQTCRQNAESYTMLFEGASLLAYTNKHLKENVDMTPPQSPSKKKSEPKVIPSPLKNFSPARKHQSPRSPKYDETKRFKQLSLGDSGDNEERVNAPLSAFLLKLESHAKIEKNSSVLLKPGIS